MITPADQTLLRRAIAIAAHAITLGDAPYGSLLADADGAILIEAHNTVRPDNDISAHPELKLARWAARELKPEAAARTTMYTSCQPCGMCTGGIARSGARAGRARAVHPAVHLAQPGTGLAIGNAGRTSAVRGGAGSD